MVSKSKNCNTSKTWVSCDWSKKYALCGEEGHKYTGSNTNIEVPEQITEENLADAMKKADRILSYRPTTVHRCVIECPLVHRWSHQYYTKRLPRKGGSLNYLFDVLPSPAYMFEDVFGSIFLFSTLLAEITWNPLIFSKVCLQLSWSAQS